MSEFNKNRREFIKDSSLLAAGAALATSLPMVAGAQAAPASAPMPAADFDINTTFTGFMKDIGGTPADGGGKVSFTGEDPILRGGRRRGDLARAHRSGPGPERRSARIGV
jgi:hypothetical protein